MSVRQISYGLECYHKLWEMFYGHVTIKMASIKVISQVTFLPEWIMVIKMQMERGNRLSHIEILRNFEKVIYFILFILHMS